MAARAKLGFSVASLLAFLLLASGSIFAQFTGSIQGIVEDPSNAAVPGAKITLVNAATGVTSSTVSDASGNYRFVSLAPALTK